VLPTMLQAVGISVPQEVQGESLLNMMKSASAEKAGSGSAAEEHQIPNSPTGRSMRNPIIRIPRIDGVRCERYETGKYLFVEAPRRELYDQGADPQAERNLAPESKAVADTLEGQLDAFRQKTSTSREAPAAHPG